MWQLRRELFLHSWSQTYGSNIAHCLK